MDEEKLTYEELGPEAQSFIDARIFVEYTGRYAIKDGKSVAAPGMLALERHVIARRTMYADEIQDLASSGFWIVRGPEFLKQAIKLQAELQSENPELRRMMMAVLDHLPYPTAERVVENPLSLEALYKKKAGQDARLTTREGQDGKVIMDAHYEPNNERSWGKALLFSNQLKSYGAKYATPKKSHTISVEMTPEQLQRAVTRLNERANGIGLNRF